MADKIREEQKRILVIIKSKEAKIKSLIFKACDNKIKEFYKAAKVNKEEGDDSSPQQIFSAGNYHPMPYTVEASAKTLYKRLAHFIRMIDYMLIQLRVNIIKNSYRNLLDTIKPEDINRLITLFEVRAMYVNKEIVFSPTVNDIKERLGRSLSDGIEMICSLPLMSSEEKFAIYMKTLEESKEKSEVKYTPLKILEENEDLKIIKKGISEALDENFKDLNDYKKNLLPFIEIYEKHCDLDFNELEGKPDQTYKSLVESIDKDKYFIADNLEETKSIGTIVLDCSGLKKMIYKKPEESKKAMGDIIPEHAEVIVNKLMDVINTMIDGITKARRDHPSTWPIDEYVKYKKFLEDHRRNTDNYEELLMKAKALHLIMNDFRMKIPGKNRRALDMMETKWKALRETFKQAMESCDSAEVAQKTTLVKEIPVIKEKLNSLLHELDNEIFYKKSKAPQAVMEELKKVNEKINNAEKLCERAEDNETYFQMPKDRFEAREGLNLKLYHLSKFWRDQVFWKENKEEWYETPVSKVDTKMLTEKINEMKSTATEAEEVLRTIFELNLDIAKDFQEKKLEPTLSAIDVINNIMKSTVEKRHWDLIATKISCQYSRDDPEFVFAALINILKEVKKKQKEENLNEIRLEEWISTIAGQAEHEYQLERKFEKIRLKWDVQLNTSQVGNMIMIQDLDVIFETLESCMMSLEKILDNKYAAPLRKKAEKLSKSIGRIHEILKEMEMVEQKIKLVNYMVTKEELKNHVFSNNRYDEVLKLWKRYLKKGVVSSEAAKDSLSQRFLLGDGKDLANYQDLNKKMDEIIIELETKLEDRQLDFPPLFFMSSKEYFRILREPNKIEVLNKCLQRTFPSVREMITIEDNDDIYPIGVISKEGEVFSTSGRGKKITDGNEAVLKSIEDLLKKDIKIRVKAFFNDYITEKKFRLELAVISLGQVAMVGEAIIFSYNTEYVLDEDEKYEDNIIAYYNEQCVAYVEAGHLLTQSEFIPSAKAQPIPLDDTTKLKLTNIIIQQIHYRDIVDFLANKNVHGSNNFYWQIQLRHYLQVENIVAKQLNAALEYGYQYLGIQVCSPITPLVERCWLSFTSALHSRFWSTIIGPKNYGKLATVRDLAISIGKFFYSYSCSTQTSMHTLEKLLIGTIGSSSWLILENTNELAYDVISSFANLLSTVRQMICEEKIEWTLDNGKTLLLVPKFPLPGNNCPYFGVFLLVDTSKPLHVPYDIKKMFRPIAITSLDLKEAAEAWLCSFGFREAHVLGPKLAIFLDSAKDLLEDDKCDFGMRTLYGIIKIAAEIRVKEIAVVENVDAVPERKIILTAIKKLFESRLTNIEDIEKIGKIILTIYIEEEEVETKTSEITPEILKKALERLEIQYKEDVLPKLIELDNAFRTYSSCIIIGNAASGKTKLLELLCNCYKSEPINELCEIFTIFPQSFTTNSLYGHFEGKDWIEGILPDKLRNLINKDHKIGYSFLHCDGPMESSWTEALHHALKCQKKLVLGNGDFVSLEGNARIVFEVDEVSKVSPAMTSLSCMVYISEELLSPKNIVNKWINGLKDKIKGFDVIQPHLVSSIDLLYNALDEREAMSKIKKERVQLSKNTIAISFCRLFEAVYLVLEGRIDRRNDFTEEKMKKLIAKLIAFCLAWSLGSYLTTERLKKIDDFIEENVNLGDKPKENSCFDVFLRLREGFVEYNLWSDLLPPFRNLEAEELPNTNSPFEYSSSRSFTQIMVPTNQLLRYKWFAEALALSNENAMLFGECGAGKSLLARYCFEGDTEAFLAGETSIASKSRMNCKKTNICFTWHTNGQQLYKRLESELEKKQKNLYSAPTFTQEVIFIDDVNLPQEDNSNNILESLREIVETKSYFDGDKFFRKKLARTSFICAASLDYGGYKQVPARLLRHFTVFYMNTKGFSNLQNLIETVVTAHFVDFPREYSVITSNYSELILESYDLISQRLPGTPRNPHYLVSYKEIGKILAGVLLGKKDNIVSTKDYERLLIYDCCRVYQDKLTSQSDKEAFVEEMNKIIEKHLNPKWRLEETELLFTSLNSPEPDQYKEVTDWKEIQTYLEDIQANTKPKEGPNINFIFFKEAIEYVAKVARILIIPRSHLINIESCSIDSKALISLAAKVYKYKVFEMGYNIRDFNNTHKEIFNEIKDLTDYKGAVLISKVGESNESSKLEEADTYENNTTKIMNSLYQVINTGKLQHLGIKRNVEDYLHVIINIPNNLSDIRLKMKMYPGLMSDCYIIYRDQWPTEAFVNIALGQLGAEVDESIRIEIAESVIKMHKVVEEEAVRIWVDEQEKILITPQQRQEVPKLFLEIYKQNEELISATREKYEKALENAKLAEVLEAKYKEENNQSRAENEKRKEETDEAYAECEKLE